MTAGTMDHLESQVSDLRNFLALPPPPPPPPSQTAASAQAAGNGIPQDSVTTPGLNSTDGYSSTPPQHPLHLHLPPRASSHHSPLFAAGDNSAQPNGGVKRPNEEDASARQQRSKRNRYISLACNECKRRKIKCNGQSPCRRCGNLNLQCLYAPNCCSNNFKDSEEYRNMAQQVTHLQEQVSALFSNMSNLRQETLRLAPIQDRVLPYPSITAAPSPSASSGRSIPRPPAPRVPPSFSGPTSLAFTMDVAKNTLHGMGCTGVADASEETLPPQQNVSGISPFLPAAAPPYTPYISPSDPLWDFSGDEMARLCHVHQDHVGLMYPVVDIEIVIGYATELATWMDSVGRNGLAPSPSTQAGSIDDTKILTLKVIMCSGLVIDENGDARRATLLYDSIQAVVDKKLMTEPASVANLPLLALVAGYRFLGNEDILAWRIIGQVARLCLELGLHRGDGLSRIQDDECRRDALNTFWTAYVLDRRWSFSTGLPYVLHDDKIDPKLPMPDHHPFLVAMITYSKLAAKIWKLVDYFEPAVIRELKQSDFETLDREILDWYESVPEAVKMPSRGSEASEHPSPSFDLHRLRIWTRLRLNQIRIWLHTPILHSASSIAENMLPAQRAVDLAKDTIEFLTWLNRTTDMYKKLQVFYHQFLTSAIAILFLASTHAPLQFSASCRTEFYMALELVKGLSARSLVSQRLWRIIHSLDSYAPWLGLRDDDGEDAAHSDSLTGGFAMGSSQSPPATGMLSRGSTQSGSNSIPPPSSLGSRSVPPASSGHHNQTQPQQQQEPGDNSNGVRLQTKMSQIFEGYTGTNGRKQASSAMDQPHHSHSPGHSSQHSFSTDGFGRGGMPSPGDELNDGMYQHLKVIF